MPAILLAVVHQTPKYTEVVVLFDQVFQKDPFPVALEDTPAVAKRVYLSQPPWLQLMILAVNGSTKMGWVCPQPPVDLVQDPLAALPQ